MKPRIAPRSRPALLALFAATLLAACAGTFEFRVHSTSPKDVAAVYLFFGKESELAHKATSSEVASLIQPSKINDLYGYVELELETQDQAYSWHELSRKLDQLKAEVKYTDDPQPEIHVGLGKKSLDAFADLAIAVVVRNAQNQYRMQSWPHSFLAETEGALVVDVTAGGVTGSTEK